MRLMDVDDENDENNAYYCCSQHQRIDVLDVYHDIVLHLDALLQTLLEDDDDAVARML